MEKCKNLSFIPKTDNPMPSKDFRPISLLPVLPKVFEHIIMKHWSNRLKTKTSSRKNNPVSAKTLPQTLEH